MRRSPKPEIKALDALCRTYIMLRDRHRCQKCGKRDRLQWAHVHTRGVHSLRWTDENSLCLCSGCHLKGHLHPLEFARWFTEAYPERARALTLMRQTARRVDRAAVAVWLKQQIKRLEAV